MREQRERLLAGIAEHQQASTRTCRRSTSCASSMREADERATELQDAADTQEDVIRDARRALDAVRALVAELDVTRATAESDLAHLAAAVLDAVGVSLDEVRAEVERMEAAGQVEPDVRAIRAAEAAGAGRGQRRRG